jgi:hypothetical protein
MNIKEPFLSLANFGLKSALSDMNTATPACFGALFAWERFYFLSFLACVYLCG